MIKSVLALRNGIMPRSLYADNPSRHIQWTDSVRLLDRERRWPVVDRPRRVGVSAFGISGTNAHVILEQAEETPSRPARPVPWVLSARTGPALRALALRLADAVDGAGLDPADVGGALARRGRLPHRAVLLDPGLEGLRAIATGTGSAHVYTGVARDDALVFLFSGDGTRLAEAGHELAATHPAFADAFAEIRAGFGEAWPDPTADPGSTPPISVADARLFALQVAQFRLLESWGVRPDAVAGGSVGEVTAAHVAGVLSVADACALITARSRLIDAVPAGSGILAEPALAEFAEFAATLEYRPPRLLVVCTVTAEPATDLGTDHWVRQARTPVRFADAVRRLVGEGVRNFLELGPDDTLSTLVSATVPASDNLAVSLCSPGRSEIATAHAALAALHVRGVPVDWPAVGGGHRPVNLPGYPFQRERFWLNPVHTAARSTVLDHGVESATSGEWIFTAALSRSAQPWLVDHVVAGETVVPGTALLDLVLGAGTAVGLSRIDELTLISPLVLPGDTGLDVQIVLGSAEADRRAVTVFARPSGAAVWAKHAEGLLDSATAAAPEPWRDGGDPVPLEDSYDTLVGTGLGYGPALRGLRELRREGSALLARAVLPDTVGNAGGWTVAHPALLDAALHAVLVAEPGPARLPFAYLGVTRHGRADRDVRVRFTPASTDTVAFAVTTTDGMPVLTVDGLVLRPAARPGVLWEQDWQPVPDARTAGTVGTVGTEVYSVPDGEPAAVLTEALQTLRSWLDSDHPGRLIVHTADNTDLSQAAVRGLVRSAQAEQPDRLVLLTAPHATQLADVLRSAVSSGQAELRVREGVPLVPRLRAVAPAPDSGVFDRPGTVLVTGGTGGLGAVFARHLVRRHGVRNLLLLSRSGPDATGARALAADLTARGAVVRVVACDVADRTALTRAVHGIGLSAVVHAAGVLDDGVVGRLTPQRLRTVLRPKLDAAQHLDELSRDHELGAFLLFSSVAGVLGTAGQGAYAAANATLDALARQRHAEGLPGLSLAWGPWKIGMAADLAEPDRLRLRRAGLVPFTEEDGLAAFDAALGYPGPVLVCARFDGVPAPHHAAGALTGQGDRFSALSTGDRASALLDLVRGHIAEVLGHREPASVDTERGLLDLGLDSLTGMELRNRLSHDTGLRLATTLVFDYPTPAALAGHLAELIGGTQVRPSLAERLATAGDDELLALLDNELDLGREVQ